MDGIWSYLINFFISTLLAALLRPKTKQNKPEATKFSDFNGPTNNQGRSIPKGFGRYRLDSPHLIYWGNYHTQEVVKKIRGPLGITSETLTLGYNYYVSMALGLCLAPGVKLLEIWADDTRQAWKGTIGNGGTAAVNLQWGDSDLKQGIKGTFKFYSGNTARDSHLQALVGADNCPNYKHLTYCVFQAPTTDLGATGLGTPSDGWVGTSGGVPRLSFVLQYIPSLAATGLDADPRFTANSNINGDANPAYVIAELITSKQAGAGLEPGFIDSPSFHNAAAVLKAEGNGVGFYFDSQRNVDDLIQEIGKQINGLVVPDPETGKLRLRLIRNTDAPALTLDEDNIVSLENFTRTALDEATNELSVQYLDPADWTEKTVICQDLGAIQQAGRIISQSTSYAGPNSQELAATLGVRDLRSTSTPLAKCTLTINEPEAQRLLPGDLVALTWPRLGMQNLGMRVLAVNVPKAHRQSVTLELLQDIFTAGRAIYSAASAPGSSTSYAVPDKPEWQQLLVGMPYGITRQSDDRLVFIASYPSTNQASANGYRPVFWTGQDINTPLPSIDAEWLSGVTARFASRGTITSNIDRTQTSGTFTVDLFTAANAYAIQQNAGKTVAVVASTGEILLASFVLSGPTTATGTIKKRGIFGTYPNAYTAGGYTGIVMLYGYAVDDQPITLDANRQLTTSIHARAITYGPGGQRGLSDTERTPGYRAPAWSSNGSAWPATDQVQATASQPYGPGLVALNGYEYTPNTGDYDVGVGQELPAGTTAFNLTWKHRNRLAIDGGGYSDYNSGDGNQEPGVTYKVRLWYRKYGTVLQSNGGTWLAWSAASTTASNIFTAPALPAGATGRLELRAEIITQKNGVDTATYLDARWTRAA